MKTKSLFLFLAIVLMVGRAAPAKQGAAKDGGQSPPSAEISEEMKKLQEEKERIRSERQVLEQQKAIMKEKKSLEEEREKLEKEKTEVAMAAPRKGWDTITGKTFKDPLTGMEFIFVKGGCYRMGDTFGDGGADEKPVHEVCIDDLYMGKYEVTQAEWQKVMGNNPSHFKGCDNCPVEEVSWNDVQEFINKLNQKNNPLSPPFSKGGNSLSPPLKKGDTGGFYRLPTEAEWEYAARSGGKNEKYAGGNALDSVAWYDNNSGNKTHPVGQKQPNGLGIYDMSGNVWEWVQDWYGENYYGGSPKNNPKGPDSGQYRVLRGGSWSNLEGYSRTAYRDRDYPDHRTDYLLGFRLVFSQ